MKRRRFALDVRPGAVALLAGLYFLLPLRWCARLALAVAVHELGHVAALVLCGTEIYGLRMEACGLALRCAPPEGAVRTIAAALAGPAAGAGLLALVLGAALLSGFLNPRGERAVGWVTPDCAVTLPIGGQRIIGGQLVALRIEQREEIGRAFAVVDLCQRFGTPRRLCLPAMSASRACCLA